MLVNKICDPVFVVPKVHIMTGSHCPLQLGVMGVASALADPGQHPGSSEDPKL